MKTSHIRLPRFTFIHGPKGTGKSTLADLLARADSGIAVCSFAEPIREALLAVFYPEYPPNPTFVTNP
jgi:2-phosphoglycerate kinase